MPFGAQAQTAGSPTPSACAARIHQARDAFQHLLVLSACLLITQQAALDRRIPPPPAQALLPRLRAMMGDHTLGLEGLANELAQAVQPQVEATPLAGAMGSALKSMLSRSNPGFKAISGGLTKVSNNPCKLLWQ